MQKNKITLRILYDNYVAEPPYEADWGFACLIEGTEKTILFDTGAKGDILLRNMERMKTALNEIDLIIISHMHNDHTGGLPAVLEKVKNIPVYLPASASAGQQDAIRAKGGQVILCKESISPCKDVWTTGEMGETTKEQSLLIKTAKGLVVITGCAHPGIAEIAERAAEIGGQPIHLLFGGFHLGRHRKDQIEAIMARWREVGIEHVGPTHCTGDDAIRMIEEAFGERYLKMGAGKIIDIF